LEKNISEKRKKEFSLLDYIEIFFLNKKKILYITLIVGAIAAFLVFVVIEPVFLSTASVKSTAKSGMLSGLLSASGLGGLGDISEFTGGNVGATELYLYENIITSRRCLEETIVKYNLMEEYNFKYMQDALKHMRENIIEIGKDKISSTMTIGVYDTKPERAKEIAEFLIYQLNKINIELNVLNARNNREFIEKRYLQTKEDLKKAEDSLKVYQDRYGIAPDVTIKVAVQTEMQLEAEIKSEEVKLEILSKILSPDQAEVKAQNGKISALKNQLFELQSNTNNESELNLKGKPDVMLNYIRLQRDIEIQYKIQSYLLPIFEQSKIEEKKEMPSVIILDSPNLPERKVKPRRMLTIFFAMSLSFILSYIYFFFRLKFKHLLNSTNDV